MGEHVLEIKQDEEVLFSGDEVSIRIIYKNLKGLNFTGMEYDQYLQQVSHICGVKINPERLKVHSIKTGLEIRYAVH